jgi:uncharacterized protein YukE
MSQAIVDPEQLRQFAMMLKRFNETLGNASGMLRQEMERLASTWRDQEHQKFSIEFEDQIKQLGRLVEASQRHIPYLIKKAELIEEYQKRG